MDKKLSLLLVALMASVLLVSGCVGQSSNGDSGREGRVVFAMTDAAANMEAVSKIDMTVDSVKVHSQSQGWVTASTGARTYDWLQLQAEGAHGLLADAQLDAGTYDQIQLDIRSVVVTDVNGTHQATLPSNEYTVDTDLVVKANSTATATFDFIAEESLRVTSEGEYVVGPVAEVETRSDAQATVQSNNRVVISGGSVTSSLKVGMDVNGNVGVGLNIPASLDLDVGADGKIEVLSVL